MIKGQYRQGDVMVEFDDKLKIPKSAKPVDPENGRVILAHGEVTGHAHAFLGGAVLFRNDGEGGATYVKVAEPKSLTHEEHSATPARKGIARVIRQREYSPEAIRNVAD